MNDEIKLDPDDMVAGAKGVASMADTYKEAISVLESSVSLTDNAFGSTAANIRENWENFRIGIWEFLADSQDNLNNAATYLADYTSDMFELDSENAETLDQVSEFDKAQQPKEQQSWVAE